MFEEFSKQFESVFRVFFIVWVSGWGLYNIGNLLLGYSEIADTSDSNELGLFFFSTLGHVVTITCGIFLLFMMSNVPGRIAKAKKATKLGIMTALVVVYYLFVTILDLFSRTIFAPEDFAEDFVKITAWLLPSIVIMVIHILYISNLRKYNETLQSAQGAK